MFHDLAIDAQHNFSVPAGLEDPQPQFRFIGAQAQDGVVQLAAHLQRPPLRPRRDDLIERIFLNALGSANSEGGRHSFAIERHVDVLVVVTCGVDDPFQRRERDALRAGRSVA